MAFAEGKIMPLEAVPWESLAAAAAATAAAVGSPNEAWNGAGNAWAAWSTDCSAAPTDD